MRTLTQLREEVLSWLDEGGDTGGTKTLVDNALNQANAQRASQSRWPWLRVPVRSFSTVIGQTDYVLDERVHKLDYLYNNTQKRFVVELPDDMAQSAGMGFGDVDVASADYFSIVGTSPIKTIIPVASPLQVTSTATEAGSATLYVEGEDANGNFITATLAPGGVASSDSFKSVAYVRKNGTWAGTLTLTAVTGTIQLLVLSVTQFAKQHPVVRLLNPPMAAETLSYRFLRAPRRMEADYDTPDVPAPYDNLLVWDALIMLAAYTEQDSESTSVWKANQQQWELNLLTTTFVGDTMGGFGEQVKLIEH